MIEARLSCRRGLAALAAAAVLTAAAVASAADEAGRFDYYVLTLSWSPTYCETEDKRGDAFQCSGARPYAFVLHGLWPQYEKGWPRDCPAKTRWVPDAVIRSMLDIMPARGLVIHEYRKHGICTGLTPEAFFAAARRAFESIAIPARYARPTDPITVAPQEIATDFVKTNPQLDQDMVAVACNGNRLREVRVCLTRELKPRACGANESQRKLCAPDRVVLPPVRGG